MECHSPSDAKGHIDFSNRSARADAASIRAWSKAFRRLGRCDRAQHHLAPGGRPRRMDRRGDQARHHPGHLRATAASCSRWASRTTRAFRRRSRRDRRVPAHGAAAAALSCGARAARAPALRGSARTLAHRRNAAMSGSMPRPGASSSGCAPAASARAAGTARSQRVLVRVDLEQAAFARRARRGRAPTRAGRCRRRGSAGNTQARRVDPVDDVEHAGDAAPLGEVGLHDGDRARRDQRVEGVVADHVLAGGERDRRRRGETLPLVPGPIGTQRLLEPAGRERRRGAAPSRSPSRGPRPGSRRPSPSRRRRPPRAPRRGCRDRAPRRSRP